MKVFRALVGEVVTALAGTEFVLIGRARVLRRRASKVRKPVS